MPAYPRRNVTEDRDPWTAAREIDQRVRIAAFEFLRNQTELRGEVLPRGAVTYRATGSAFPFLRANRCPRIAAFLA